ncbi:MAG: hypothetical protein LBH19_14740 [Dysgonamonadaceae bacterium]|jgi:hypothetical protein|nr:hypothetical protein [Dysgonamonadaceae bacterium]
MKKKKIYTPPAITNIRVALEDSMAGPVASPVRSVTLEEWEDGGTNVNEIDGDIGIMLPI